MMTASCVYARKLVTQTPGDRSPEELADLFCHQARDRVAIRFSTLFRNQDAAAYRVARNAMGNRYGWLTDGVLKLAMKESRR